MVETRLIKTLKYKHLNPRILGSLDPGYHQLFCEELVASTGGQRGHFRRLPHPEESF